MPTHKEVYESHADEYEALVSREDYEGNILKTIERMSSLEGLDVLDLGAGTGRLTALLAPKVRSILAFDLSQHMLSVAHDRLREMTLKARWLTAASDHRLLPLPPQSADLIVSGWSVSYVAIWQPATWRQELDAWLAEAVRVLRRNGRIILFESLGTGNENPKRLPHLEGFYDWLDEARFEKTWIRTDYRFESEQVANDLASFFFGEEIRNSIRLQPIITLPECTGVWWRRP
jgi:ubiquinone/menaquinone biosynthesis C-methylase UbiE